MANGSFTDVYLRSLRPRKARYTVYEKDARYEGFFVDVMPSGKLSFRYRYRLNKKREKVTIGSYPIMSLATARTLYREMLDLVHKGVSPAAKKRLARKGALPSRTFEDLARDWVKDVLQKSNKNSRQDEGYLTRHILPILGQKAPNTIVISDLWSCIDPKKRDHPQAARRIRSVVKRVLDYGLSRGEVTANVAASINPAHIAPAKPRDRVLTRQEIPIWLHAVETSGMSRPLKLALRLLLLVPVRKGELLAARWHDVDLAAGLWDIPKESSKNGAPLRHKLPEQAASIFQELYALAAGSQWVLPSSRGSGRKPISKTTLNRALDAVGGLPKNVVIHDLRRTVRTYLSELGVPTNVAELCLNHRPTGIAKVYDRAELIDQRYHALVRWQELLQTILRKDVEPSDNSSEIDELIRRVRGDPGLRQYVLKQLL